MMATLRAPTPFVIIQSVAVASAGLAAGTNIGTTLTTLPPLLLSPAPLLARQWLSLYNEGLKLVVSASVLSGTLFAYTSYATPSPNQTRVLGAASVLAFGLLPYTRLAMWGLNNRLMELGEEGAKVETEGKEGKVGHEGEVKGLVERWGKLNLIRGFIPLAGAVVGVWGVSLGF